MSALDELQDYIDGLWIVDTHEHLPAEKDRPADSDVLTEWLTHYFSCDLVSAGLAPKDLGKVTDSSGDLMKRWDMAEPYWQAARSTGYGRALDIAARGLYGIESVNRDTIGPLNDAFLAAREKSGHYQYVLKEKSRIALSIVDARLDCDEHFFVSALRFDHFIRPQGAGTLASAARDVGVRLHTLEDVKEALRLSLDKTAQRKTFVTVKMGLAYERTLHFAKTTHAKAEEEFNQFMFGWNAPGCHSVHMPGRAYQDYMMHYLMELAEERELPVQIHTGLHEGTGNVIENSNPVLLTNLFIEYPGVRFDIFHMGYPYMMEMSNLAKNFRNVFIDMAWGNIISPEAARRALVEWLDAVPANKISAFGGDYCFVDGVYGHQKIARGNVAAALAQKVADGSFDLDRAKEIAHWLLVDNPTRIFRLEDRVRAGE